MKFHRTPEGVYRTVTETRVIRIFRQAPGKGATWIGQACERIDVAGLTVAGEELGYYGFQTLASAKRWAETYIHVG